MPISATMYGKFPLSAVSGEVDLTSDTLKVMLTTSAYTPDQDAHQYKSSVTNEVSGTGYTAGGQTLANVTVTYDNATNRVTLDADDTTWANSTITARRAVIYDDTPSTNATKPLIGWVDFDADESSENANFSIQWDADGISHFTVS